MTSQDVTTLRRLHAHLRRELPVEKPVHLRIASAADKAGMCNNVKDKRYLLTVWRGAVLREAIGVLLHEYAHAITLGMDDAEPHGEFFRLAEAAVFHSYLNWRRKQ